MKVSDDQYSPQHLGWMWENSNIGSPIVTLLSAGSWQVREDKLFHVSCEKWRRQAFTEYGGTAFDCRSPRPRLFGAYHYAAIFSLIINNAASTLARANKHLNEGSLHCRSSE